MNKLFKGPRVAIQVRVPPQDHLDIKARATAAGLTISEYVIELVHRDQVDAQGLPQWATTREEQLPLPA